MSLDVVASFPCRMLDGKVFKNYNAFEEVRAAWNVAPLLHFNERTMLVKKHFSLLLLNHLQPRHEGHIRRHFDSHRQAIDEQTEHRIDTIQLWRPSRNGRAKNDVVTAAVTAQQKRPRTLDDDVQRQPLAASECLQSFGRSL